jgi:hypothetical protein
MCMHSMLLPIVSDKPSIMEPPVRARPSVDVELLFSIHPELLNDSYVYLHCSFDNTFKEALLRIWRTTYLIDRASGNKSSLIHAENITFAPQWTLIPDNSLYTFLLIFHALPKSCLLFDFVEEISQPGGFFVQNIARNRSDVYHVLV